MTDNLATRVEEIVRQMLASPQGLLGRQFFPMLGAGRNETGRVPRCVVYRGSNQTLTTATLTAIQFSTASVDTSPGAQMWASTANTRLTIREPGSYLLLGSLQFAANVTGVRAIYIRYNGSTILGTATQDATSGGASTDMLCHVPTLSNFGAGDYLELVGFQSSGGDLAVVSASSAPFLSAVLVGNI